MASTWKDRVQSGWQQGKEGSSTLKGRVKNLVGRGDDYSSSNSNHVATPRSSLRDPSSFPPPPKHVAAYQPVVAPTTSSNATVTAPVTSDVALPRHAQQPQQIEEPLTEPRPYRIDTTGLSTSHFPPPPRPSAHSHDSTTAAQATKAAKPRVPPSLPPRLPARNDINIQSPSYTTTQPASQGYLDQNAINNLGAAGISVPGLGIGGVRTNSPRSLPETRIPPRLTKSSTQVPGYGQGDELQARFARMDAPPSLQESGTGTTSSSQQHLVGHTPSVVGKKRPPPPPLPKKPVVSRMGTNTNTAPPVPLATRPKFD
ncbi:hypothetical protein GGS21DRAFT_491995 [Xylaria nigripes]|nr:hypothetical protein GGS21DRAFT_491995 [Xylaria nigripes]